MRDALIYAHFDYSTLGEGEFDISKVDEEGFTSHVKAKDAILNDTQIGPLIEIAISSLSASHQRKAVRKAEAKVLSEEGDYDDECAEEVRCNELLSNELSRRILGTSRVILRRQFEKSLMPTLTIFFTYQNHLSSDSLSSMQNFGVNQHEDGLQVLIAEFLKVLAKLYGDRWLGLDAVRSTLIPNLFNMGQAHVESTGRKFAVMCLVDIFEFVVIPCCDRAALNQFLESFIDVLILGLKLDKEQDEESLEAATHGALVLACHSPGRVPEQVKQGLMLIVEQKDAGWMLRGKVNAREALEAMNVRSL